MKASALPKGRLIKTSGLGSFKYKLNQGIHTTGELHTLHDNEKAVEKLGQIVISQKRYIRGSGLSNYQIRKDVNEIKSADKNLTLNDKRVVKGILKGMSSESYAKAGSEENKAATHGQFVYKRNVKPAAITSIANRTGKTSAFHQYGDAVSQDKSRIYSSINAAIKNNHAADTKTEDDKPNQALNENLKPAI